MKKTLIALLALAAAVSVQAGSEEFKATEIPGVIMSQDDRTTCAKIATTPEQVPCTVWSAQELADYSRDTYAKGWAHGRAALIDEFKRQREADEENEQKQREKRDHERSADHT